jgi:hypothetical protein
MGTGTLSLVINRPGREVNDSHIVSRSRIVELMKHRECLMLLFACDSSAFAFRFLVFCFKFSNTTYRKKVTSG